MSALTPFPQQRRAIEAPAGPVLVLAGPGAGKTYCLISRVHHLVTRHGIAPARVCAVTFTNKAAEEIARRLRDSLGSGARDVSRGTLHALSLAVLREHASQVGLRDGFGVADPKLQEILLQRLGVHPRRWSTLLNLFGRSRLQGAALEPEDERLHHQYRSRLRAKNLIDFDDIIAFSAQLLRTHPAIGDAVSRRWDYVLVDEFQDLNLAQYAIVKELVRRHRNVFVVGDDEQSIYAWAGADPEVLRRFCGDFDIDEPIVLDRNCRCSRQILESARRLLTHNPALFDKSITAERESRFAVEAYAFETDADEAAWILHDIQRDRITAAPPAGWGDYAILYRRHSVGEQLEKHLVRHGIPCRLARGRSLVDDPVVGYVVASLQLLRDLDNQEALREFAARVLPSDFLEHVRAAAPADEEFLASFRAFARRQRHHPDAKKAWRFIYHVNNLAAIRGSHEELGSLIEELLSQRVGPYRNPMEEHFEDLSDPRDFPGAAALAERLREASARSHRIVLTGRGGVEIALRGLLGAAAEGLDCRYAHEVEAPDAADVRLGPHELPPGRATMTLFKALQVIQSEDFREVLREFVTFDFETTDRDVDECEIIEIGAARVREGRIVDRFRTLVRPTKPVSAGAEQIHGYRDADLLEAPTLGEAWPHFREFVGDDVLVAHNGQWFDVPVLRRLAAPYGDVDRLTFYDTLPLARSLFHESARLVDLAQRFGVDTGRSHHALDDAVTLAHVFACLSEHKIVRARKAALVSALDYVGLGLALESTADRAAEDDLIRDLARPFTLGRHSDCLDWYASERDRAPALPAPPVDEVIRRLGGQAVMDRIRAKRSATQRYPTAMGRIEALVDASRAASLDESIGLFLQNVALSTSEGVEADPHRVNLLTLHSTKGLEFSRVYVAGVEDSQLPGQRALAENCEDEIQEARRLLYVGMTRARERLVLTRADERGILHGGGSRFLREIGLELRSPALDAG